MLTKLGESRFLPKPVAVKDAGFPSPFRSTLEFGAPARGAWNIVHTGMLLPEAHQIFVCAQGCLRGVVLTAAEMGAGSRFSTITIEEHNVLDGFPGRFWFIPAVSTILWEATLPFVMRSCGGDFRMWFLPTAI